MKKLLFVLSLLLLVACNREQPSSESIDDKSRGETPATEQVALADFFLKDGAVASFRGEGNEFATYTAKTERLFNRYVNVYEDNGGTVVLRTFRIDEDKIVVIQEKGEAYEMETFTEEQLTVMTPLYTYLQLPLKVGTTFDNWTITDTNATVETPLQTFKEVIIIEGKGEGESITRRYFAKGFGEIKREFVMVDGDQEFRVTSTIEKVE